MPNIYVVYKHYEENEVDLFVIDPNDTKKTSSDIENAHKLRDVKDVLDLINKIPSSYDYDIRVGVYLG
jgi:hypothetical protein